MTVPLRVLTVVRSCRNPLHVSSARRYANLWARRHGLHNDHEAFAVIRKALKQAARIYGESEHRGSHG